MADRWRVEPGPGGPHAWTVRTPDGARATGDAVLAVMDDRGSVWVWIDGRTHVVPLPEPAAGPSNAGTGPDALTSPMPATVASVAVAVGDRVEAGDTLLLLEAMKMEMPLRAARAGLVDEVRCAAGDLVQPGVPLVVLKEGQPDDGP